MVSWNLLVQNWDSTSGWLSGGYGIRDINPAGQLRLIPDNAESVDRIRDIGTLPATYTAEFRVKVDDFGDEGFWSQWFFDGVHWINFRIYATYIHNVDSGQTINIVTTEGVFYTWRLVIDSTGHHLYVYRDAGYLGDLGPGLNSGGDGFVYCTGSNGAGDDFVAHQDYLYIATGLQFIERNEDLKATFHVGQDSLDLKATFDVGQGSEDLPAELIIRNAGIQDLFAKFTVRHTDTQDLFADLTIRHTATEDIFSEFVVRHTGTEDLHCFFHVGQDSKQIFSKMVIRHSDTFEIFGKFIPRRTSTYDMPAQFEVGQDREDLRSLVLISGIGYIVRGEYAF